MSGQVLNEDDNIEQLLEELVRGTDALTALLLRLDGACLYKAGDTAQVNTAVLSLLVAAMVRCCRDVARVVGEDRFCTVVQHGANRHVHVTILEDSYVLVVAFEDDRQTGLVRLQSGRTVAALKSFLTEGTVLENNGHTAEIPALLTRSADLIDRIFAGPQSMEHGSDAH